VAQVKYKDGTGIYAVTLPEAAKFSYERISGVVPRRYVIEKLEARFEGEASKDDKGLWLTAPSGPRVRLANRPKKDEKDAPPDLVKAIEKGLKAGRTALRVEGVAKGEKEPMTLQLASAEFVEKKTETK